MKDRIQQRLAALRPGAHKELREALRSKIGLLVATAAKVVGEHGPDALLDELPAAFARMLEKPLERDPGCRATIAIARVLEARDRWEDEVFLRAVRHVQLEPVWGGREDTAAELRGIAAMAYAHAGRGDALDVCAELLADPQRMARAAAAQALGDTGRPDATAVLRLKVMIGDPEMAVLSACFGSLLALAPEPSRLFAERFLDGDDDRAEPAALALGEARAAASTSALIRWCDACTPAVRGRVGYLALALLRDDAATAHLLEVVAGAGRTDAIAAVRALATFREDAALAERTRAAAAAHPDREVRAEARAAFA